MCSFRQWMYLRGLLNEADDTGSPMVMFHGTVKNGAQSIMHGGLQKRSSFEITNMAGEFWCTSSHEYASTMALVVEYDPPTAENPPVVLKFTLPAGFFNLVREGKHYEQHGLGTFEFKSSAYRFLNGVVKDWTVVPLTPNIQMKWQQELQSQGGVAQPQMPDEPAPIRFSGKF